MMKKKILFFDIETSWSVNKTFQIGDVHLNHNSILEDGKIICICYKWKNKKKVHSLHWDANPNKKAFIKGDDRRMIKDFAKTLLEADLVIAQNGDNFDIKWFRTQCLLYKIIIPSDIITLDTLKLSRKYFRWASNRLDYVSKRLGHNGKGKIGEECWDKVTFENSQKHLKEMIKYCKRDVLELEAIYLDYEPYIKPKLSISENRAKCPDCGGDMKKERVRPRASGVKMVQLSCKDCGRFHDIPLKTFEKYEKSN